MQKLDDELIKKINSYWEDTSDREIWRRLGISRKTVAKYREDIIQALSKEDKLKQELVKTYSADELRDLLTEENVESMKYIEFTVGYDDMNYIEVFQSVLGDKILYCADVIDSDEEIVNNFYYYNLDELVRQIAIDWELED